MSKDVTFTISAPKSGYCPHSGDGKPAGYPMFCCAWPRCPMGVDAPSWRVSYGAHGGVLKVDEFEREKWLIDGVVSYSWKKIE